MKSAILSFIAFILVSTSSAQNPVQADVCLSIPNLTSAQKAKIEQLSSKHQKNMDNLRSMFWSETSSQEARELKLKMDNEQNNHYQAITSLLTDEQKVWFSRNCLRSNRQGLRQGRGRGYGYGCGRGRGRGYGHGRGRGI